MDRQPLRQRQPILAIAATLAVLCSAGPTASQEEIAVDLELVLAVDVSLSTQFEESATQRRGYIRAFMHDEVIAAIEAGAFGRVAVTYFEWSGSTMQDILVPWMVIDGRESARVFADLLFEAPLQREHTTSISSALLFGMGLMENNGFAGERRVIDISGDGPNNAGIDIITARNMVVERGVTINGLPVVVRPDSWRDVFEGGIPAYYENCVIGGDGAFIVTVSSMADFIEAIRQKMVLEIAAAPEPKIEPFSALPDLVIPVQARPAFDCIMSDRIPVP